MSTITKQWLQQTIAEYETNRDELPFGLDTNSAIELQAFKLALASLTADPVAGEARFKEEHHWSPCTAAHVAMVLANPSDWPNYEVRYLYTAPPAPESVPDEMTMADAIMEIDVKDADRWTGRIGFQKGWNACRAAMLQGGK
ncbi:TPA: hypothetical protein I8190_004679 [Citrobacter freundii]|nr:hypothetical protein [Citrobacter farmeri]HAT2287732.1 hypothetical protein [Citrobacter freundii]HAT2351864.1 hypothetical protein [Citrobacter freundii]HAT2433401.1 hypothetical protein [Citrobacter freundii]HAT2502495.1 hypothetical protein [Citrobacter freundii]